MNEISMMAILTGGKPVRGGSPPAGRDAGAALPGQAAFHDLLELELQAGQGRPGELPAGRSNELPAPARLLADAALADVASGEDAATEEAQAAPSVELLALLPLTPLPVEPPAAPAAAPAEAPADVVEVTATAVPASPAALPGTAGTLTAAALPQPSVPQPARPLGSTPAAEAAASSPVRAAGVVAATAMRVGVPVAAAAPGKAMLPAALPADAARAGQTVAEQAGSAPAELAELAKSASAAVPEASGLPLPATAGGIAPIVVAPPAAAAPAEARAAMVAVPFGQPGWSEAVNQRVVWMLGQQEHSALLTLNPPELGPLQVVIHVHNNQADATFLSDQQEVRRALEDGMANLRDMMQQAGLQLGQADVRGGRGRPAPPPELPVAAGEASTAEPASAAAVAVRQGLLNVFA